MTRPRRRQRLAGCALLCSAAALPAQEVRETTLDNGVRVVLVERPELPLVTFAVYLRGGLLLDTPATFRHGSLALGCLWMGHRDQDEEAVRGALADIGAEFGSFVDLQDSRVHLSCLAQHADKGIALFADALLHPAFSDAVVNREREQEQHLLAQRRKQPEHLAQAAFVRALVGTHALADAYALTDEGGGLARADRDAVVAAWQRMVQPQLATLFVVGRVSEDLLALVRARMGTWVQPRAVTRTEVPAPKDPGQAGRVIKVAVPETTQVYVQFGMLGPAPQAPEAASVHVLRLAIAGGFTSALEDELRVNRGLIYDIAFTSPSLTFPPPYSLTTRTRADRVGEVLDVSMQALRAARQDALRPEQVEAARNLWLVGRAQARETHLGLADALHRSLRLFGDFAGMAREAAAVRGTTLRDVAAAAAVFDPARFVVVMVGTEGDLAKVDWHLAK